MSAAFDFRSLILRAPYPIRYVATNAYGALLAHRRFSGGYASILRELEVSQWEDPKVLRACQEERLRALIRYAYDSVPYYRRIMNERGLRPRDIDSIADLIQLPVLTKNHISEHFDELTSSPVPKRKALLHHTSGTTGAKLRGFLVPRELLWTRNYADLYRAYRWAGFDHGDRRATIAGRWFTQSSPYTMVNHAERQLLLSAHHLNDETASCFLKALTQFRPKAIQGHPSAIDALARYALASGQAVPEVPIVLTTGEQLFSDQRNRFQEVFGAETFDGWGQGEQVARAYECDCHEGYHVSSEFGIVEIDESVEMGEGIGEIIATSLHNEVMPLIRYRTGDLAAWTGSPCSCGRGLPLLHKLVGRIDDAVDDVDGKRVLAVSIRTDLSSIDGLGSYQLVQTDDGRYRIECVIRMQTRGRGLRDVREHLLGLLGSSAQLDICEVPAITRTDRGKQRLVVDARGYAGDRE